MSFQKTGSRELSPDLTATPLIICGMGRSGTRNAANVLNCHPKIMLFGEMPLPIMRQLFGLLDEVDQFYRKKEKHNLFWMNKKERFFYESFSLLGKAPPSRWKNDFIYVGHKTPRHEIFFDDYERHFASLGKKPVYVYCMRDIVHCWRSYKSMDWVGNRTLSKFLDEYSESYGRLERMQAAAPDRVIILSLNEIISARDKVEHYTRNLFQPLGLEVSAETVARIEKLQNVNATVRVTGRAPQTLSHRELRMIAHDPRIRRLTRLYFPELDLGPPPTAVDRIRHGVAGYLSKLERSRKRLIG